MSNRERKCITCGRIITDCNNISGLCPRCQKKENSIIMTSFLAVAAIGVKKYGPTLIKGLGKIVKK